MVSRGGWLTSCRSRALPARGCAWGQGKGKGLVGPLTTLGRLVHRSDLRRVAIEASVAAEHEERRRHRGGVRLAARRREHAGRRRRRRRLHQVDDERRRASPTFSGEAGGVGSLADGLDLRSRIEAGRAAVKIETRFTAGDRVERRAGRRRGGGGRGARGGRRRTGRRCITADVKSVAAARMPEGDEFFAASSAITRSSGWPGRGRRATGAASERGCAPIAAAAAAAVAAAAAAAAAAIASPTSRAGTRGRAARRARPPRGRRAPPRSRRARRRRFRRAGAAPAAKRRARRQRSAGRPTRTRRRR